MASIEIGNSVTEIGGSAFAGCKSLASIEIPNSVTSIGESAFKGCTSLASIEIGNSVTSIERSAFEGCNGLESIVVKNGNSTYDSRDNCNALIKTATNTLISGCMNTVIPNSVTSIGEYAFADCTSLASIEIPNSVTSIGESAFSFCSSLRNITIEDGAVELKINSTPFYYCRNIDNLYIGREISGIAFDECSFLASIRIGNEVSRLNNIISNSYLNSFIVPSSVNYFYCRFSGCHINIFTIDSGSNELTTGHWGTSTGGGGWVSGHKFLPLIDAAIDTLVIDRDIKFTNITPFNSKFKTVKIGKNVTYLDDSAFQVCSIDSLIIEHSKDTLQINPWALSCKVLSKLNLNRDLSDYSFTPIQNIYIGDSICNIPDGAFRSCTHIKQLSLGRKLDHIGAKVFNNQYKYTFIDIITSYNPIPPIIQSDTFWGYNSVLMVPCGALEAYKNAPYWRLFFDIKEMDSSIDIVISDENDENDIIEVYNLSGIKMPITRRSQIATLPHGIYIINGVKRAI